MSDNAELDALLWEISKQYEGQLTAGNLGPAVRYGLEDAAQAGREWAERMLDRTVERGCYFLWKDWYRAANTGVFRSHTGEKIGKSRVRSVRRVDPETGATYKQLELIESLSWAELHQVDLADAAQIAALQVSREGFRRLFELERRHPETFGPSEAATSAGTSIEAVLAGEFGA